MPTEIEAKFLNINIPATREKLAAAGYTCTHPRRIMNRATFHGAGDRRNMHEWWRVRDEGNGKITMTWKHTDSHTVDGTRELETTVGDFETTIEILTKTGLTLVARQETARETWVRDQVEIVIDEWPGLNPFIEVEGPTREMVEQAAHALGYDMQTAVFGGVGNVYQIELGYVPEAVNNWPVITFANPPRRAA